MESRLPPTTRAGAGVRLAARFVDGLVLFIPTLVITAPISGGVQVGSPNSDTKQAIATAIAVVLAYGYFVLAESIRGTTVGKAAFGIDVRTAQGSPTVEQSAKRNSFMLLSIVPTVIGGLLSIAAAIAIAISISQDPRGQGYHDRFAGVVVDRD
jgi:uncharacterized RDD family membrane protein YckC